MILKLRPTARTCANHLPPLRYWRSSRSASTVAVALLLLSFLLPLAGCGSSDNGVAAKSATQILAATRTAAQSASSVRLIASSQIAHGPSLTLNAGLARDRGHAKVSLLGMSMEVIRTTDTIYVKGNKVFAARMGGALGVKIPANTWLKGSVKGPLAQTSGFTNIATELPLTLSGTGKIAKGARTRIDGQPAIALKQEHKLYTGTLYVATTGQPYPLKLTKTGQETGQTTFTDWNDPVTVSPPANAIEISHLQHIKKG